MREVGVLTTSRADFGIYLPVLEAMRRRGLRERIIASGSHLTAAHGRTEREIVKEGWSVYKRVNCLGHDMASTMARMLAGLSGVFRRWRPDVLVVLGDRFEMFAGAAAAVPFRIPIAHLHGGEVTGGAVDELFRHAITKLSHLHFCATRDAADRIARMGEARWRITLSGAPALDHLRGFRALPMKLPERFLLVTYHPVTQEPGRETEQARVLVKALEACRIPCVVTAPNADPGREEIARVLQRFVARDPGSMFLTSAGSSGYFTLMSRAMAMVGNSSSGLIEAPSFRLPVVNIGSRQKGRLRAANVIDSAPRSADISRAIRRAIAPAFRASLRSLRNPYGAGRAGERIAERLASVPLDEKLLRKEFSDS